MVDAKPLVGKLHDTIHQLVHRLNGSLGIGRKFDLSQNFALLIELRQKIAQLRQKFFRIGKPQRRGPLGEPNWTVRQDLGEGSNS